MLGYDTNYENDYRDSISTAVWNFLWRSTKYFHGCGEDNPLVRSQISLDWSHNPAKHRGLGEGEWKYARILQKRIPLSQLWIPRTVLREFYIPEEDESPTYLRKLPSCDTWEPMPRVRFGTAHWNEVRGTSKNDCFRDTLFIWEQQLVWKCQTKSQKESRIKVRTLFGFEHLAKAFCPAFWQMIWRSKAKWGSLSSWYSLVEQYSRRKLTVASDILPSISGVASEIQRQFYYAYLHGL